ncbi:MAG: hypothetical protein IJ391_02170, partial [Clostridia bacterium]|nr:hypothetical protein [Clostridia bacterium]
MKSKHYLTRVLVMLLCFTMLIGAVPMSAATTETTETVTPVAIADGDNLTATEKSGFICESIAATDTDPAHIRFTVEAAEAAYKWDNIRAIATINTDIYPEGFSLGTSDVVKLVYRTNSAGIG